MKKDDNCVKPYRNKHSTLLINFYCKARWAFGVRI